MYFHQILEELNDLRKTWRKQNFSYTKEQKERFEELQMLRRARVNFFYENNMVATPKVVSTK